MSIRPSKSAKSTMIFKVIDGEKIKKIATRE
jgi:hypothetical protein